MEAQKRFDVQIPYGDISARAMLAFMIGSLNSIVNNPDLYPDKEDVIASVKFAMIRSENYGKRLSETSKEFKSDSARSVNLE